MIFKIAKLKYLGYSNLTVILIIIAVALILRLINLNQSLWLDEAINVNVASNLDFFSLIKNYSLGDFHPPLYHVFINLWISLFGNSEIAVRLPSVVFGVGTVFVTYLLGRKLFDKRTALIAATLLATSPLHVYYSQEARMYALAAFLTSLSVYFFISILKKDTLIYWAGFIFSTILMLYSDYLPYLLMPIYLIYTAIAVARGKIAKTTFKAFIPAFILIFILLIPWLIIFPEQLKTGLSAAAASPAWAKVVGSTEIKDLLLVPVKFTVGRISHDNNLIYAALFLPVAVFEMVLFCFSLFRLSFQRLFLFFWLFGSIILAFVISFFLPIFAYFRLLFTLPAFYLILSTGINTLNLTKSIRILLIGALLVNTVSLAIYYIDPKFHREDWKSAVQFINQNATPNTVVIFESDFTLAPFEYYDKGKVKASGALSGFYADPKFVSQNIDNLTLGKDTIYLFQYLSDITDPTGEVFRQLTNKGFFNTQTKDFANVGFVYEFKRQ